jgi:hypothetical protein
MIIKNLANVFIWKFFFFSEQYIRRRISEISPETLSSLFFVWGVGTPWQQG